MNLKNNITLEGCDSVGKSCVAKILAEKCGYQIIKMSAPKDKEDGKKKNIEMVDKLNAQVGFVLDRGILGESAYSEIKRGYKAEYIPALEALLQPWNWLVLIDCCEKEVQKRFDGEFITREEISIILQKFREAFAESKVKRKILVSSCDMSAQEIADYIYKKVKESAL